MRFVEAFTALGYDIENYRTDWSAQKEDGVVITVWNEELQFDTKTGDPYFDSRKHAKPIAVWGHKTGNQKRIGHLRRAIDEFDGFVDVIIVFGVPGEGYGSADPLRLKPRSKRCRIVYFDDQTGHFRVEVR